MGDEIVGKAALGMARRWIERRRRNSRNNSRRGGLCGLVGVIQGRVHANDF